MVDNALVDQTVNGAPPLTRYQFERCGFFCIDYDSLSDKVNWFTAYIPRAVCIHAADM